MEFNVLSIIIAMGIPSAITAFCFWMIKRNIDRREEKIEKREEVQRESIVLLVEGVGAAIALGEATAHAIQRGYPNGDMESALEYAKEIKHKQKDFLTEQGIKNIY